MADYLTVVYGEGVRPYTTYPLQLIEYLFDRFVSACDTVLFTSMVLTPYCLQCRVLLRVLVRLCGAPVLLHSLSLPSKRSVVRIPQLRVVLASWPGVVRRVDEVGAASAPVRPAGPLHASPTLRAPRAPASVAVSSAATADGPRPFKVPQQRAA